MINKKKVLMIFIVSSFLFASCSKEVKTVDNSLQNDVKGAEITKETPTTEISVSEAPKSETPVSEVPKSETPVSEVPKSETPVSEAPKTETPKPETPKPETPKTETPKPTPTPEPQKPEIPESKPTPEPPAEIKESSTGSVSSSDMYFNGNGKIAIKDTNDKAIEVMGDGFDLSEAISCDYDGMDKIYTYNGVTIFTYPTKSGKYLIGEIMLTDATYSTNKGISSGSTKAEIIEKYGDNFNMEGKSMVYQKDGVSLRFLVSNDKVKTISWTK